MKRIKPYILTNILQTIYRVFTQPNFDYSSHLRAVCITNNLKTGFVHFYHLKNPGFSRTFFTLLKGFCKVLNGYTGPNLKESVIRRNTRQINCNLRNDQTDLVV